VKLLLPLLLLQLCGCTSFVRELHKPPYPYTMAQHSRVVGIKASWQGYGIQLGFVSESVTFIPASTNKIYMAPISDEFVLGQHMLDASIKERIVTGYDGAPPPPLMKIFSPKDQPPPKPNENNPSSHSKSFSKDQGSLDNRPLTPRVGLFDSAAPKFSLLFDDHELRPVAVTELVTDSVENVYSVISNPITYPDMPPSPTLSK